MFATLRSRVLVATLLASCAIAQESSSKPASSSTDEGVQLGAYHVQQSFEVGYRFVDRTGNQQIYDTFIDQREGPRILEQSLSMRSPQHTGALFDDLYVNSFGWGGDPENVARARVTKHRMYDFTALFRRDYTRFDYPLLANPLNPPSTPNFAVTFSPHATDIARRMYDFGLTILPQSRFTVRLGYSRNRNEGNSLASYHEGTDVLLFQPWNFSGNDYRIGFDFKLAPSTTISYDQFVSTYKNDTGAVLAPFATFKLPDGTDVELGLPWNFNPLTAAPCRDVFLNGAVNPVCNGYFSYARTQHARSTTPTEQLTINSHFGKFSLFARGSYSSTNMDSPFNEAFNGFVTRTSERQFSFVGPANVRRIGATGEVGLTFALTDSIQLNNTFRLDNWRIPGQFSSVETIATGTDLLSTPVPVPSTSELVFNFLGQKSYENTFQVEFTGSRRVGGQIGYRFRHRNVFKAEPEVFDPEAPFEGFEGDDIDIDEHGVVAGLWFRPIDELRVNLNVETMNADNNLTRISPRNRQNYRGRITYKATDWATVGGTVNWIESRNPLSDINTRQHYRNAGLTLTLLPNERFSFDFSSGFTDALQNTFICYNGTFLAPGTIPNACPTFAPGTNVNPNWIYSRYEDTIFDFNAAATVRPVKRVSFSLGYGVVNSGGNTTILNPLQPTGTLNATFHRPSAAVSFEVYKNVSLNGYWNYDQYSESDFVGPTSPRYFHSNRAVVSAKYAF